MICELLLKWMSTLELIYSIVHINMETSNTNTCNRFSHLYGRPLHTRCIESSHSSWIICNLLHVVGRMRGDRLQINFFGANRVLLALCSVQLTIGLSSSLCVCVCACGNLGRLSHRSNVIYNIDGCIFQSGATCMCHNRDFVYMHRRLTFRCH